MTLQERFGANLKRIRRKAGLSQERLSLLASIHRTEISMLERGLRLPRIDTLVKLAAALEVSPEALLTGIAWKLPPPSPVLGHFELGESR